jgi:hypothetical protein
MYSLEPARHPAPRSGESNWVSPLRRGCVFL